jgi:carbamoyl-phosphate synthase large subunit
MKRKTNILILSCGTRSKIVQYFRRELGNRGDVIAADCSELAPALYEADTHFVVPRMGSEGYIERILEICRENDVRAVFSLIDPELSLLAAHKEDFLNIGVLPVVSDVEQVELSFNKYKFNNFLKEKGYASIRSYVDINLFYKDLRDQKIQFPVFVKPVAGSASINVNKVETTRELDLLFERYDNLIIQEYIEGKEFGVDVYIDLMTHEPTAVFIKEKIKMRAGETDKSVSVKNPELFKLIKKFVKEAGYTGVIDIDIFQKDGTYYISEVNPRFGGGYPHAYESNVNIPEMVINNVQGKINSSAIGRYSEGIYMMKYNDIMIYKPGVTKKPAGDLLKLSTLKKGRVHYVKTADNL